MRLLYGHLVMKWSKNCSQAFSLIGSSGDENSLISKQQRLPQDMNGERSLAVKTPNGEPLTSDVWAKRKWL